MVEADEFLALRDRIAQVQYEFHHPPDKEMAWDDIKDAAHSAALAHFYYGRADAVLDALGLEQVGWRTFTDDTRTDWWWFDADDSLPSSHLNLVSEPVYRLSGEATNGR